MTAPDAGGATSGIAGGADAGQASEASGGPGGLPEPETGPPPADAPEPDAVPAREVDPDLSLLDEGPLLPPSRTPARRQVVSEKPFRGRYVRAIPADGIARDVAWDATLRAVAAEQRARRKPGGLAVEIRADELLRRQRLRRPARLLLFVVDVSGSMGGRLMGIAKRAALVLLQRAYVKRDHVSMVCFRDRSAELLFPPTNQAERVRRELAGLACGGKTPLAHGLDLAHRTLSRALAADAGLTATMVLISDGQGNVGFAPGHGTIHSEVGALARALRELRDLTVLFLDTTRRGREHFLTYWLTGELGAERFELEKLTDEGRDPVVEIVRSIG